VTASGATVPAFGPESLVSPSLIVLAQPAADSSGNYTIVTSADVPVAWTGGQSGDTVIVQGLDSTGTTSFSCYWDATAGQGTIPHAVLAPLAGQTNAALFWDQYVTKRFVSGSYSISETVVLYGEATATYQ
jgi:hypothetical protein